MTAIKVNPPVPQRISYTVEIEVDDMLAILKVEEVNWTLMHLYEKLDKLQGVSDIDYNGHFGPHIFYTVTAASDEAKLHAAVKTMIADHISTCRTHLKGAKMPKKTPKNTPARVEVT